MISKHCFRSIRRIDWPCYRVHRRNSMPQILRIVYNTGIARCRVLTRITGKFHVFFIDMLSWHKSNTDIRVWNTRDRGQWWRHSEQRRGGRSRGSCWERFNDEMTKLLPTLFYTVKAQQRDHEHLTTNDTTCFTHAIIARPSADDKRTQCRRMQVHWVAHISSLRQYHYNP